MILVDTSIWVDHLRLGDGVLVALLNSGSVLGHPWIVGEVALGNLAHRDEIIGLLQGLPQATLATDSEVLTLIQKESLSGAGIGYVDAQLLAATRLSSDARLWTRDKRLSAVTDRLELGFQPAGPVSG
ncbi:MAG TPA: type II toxin-antitoxin system VapC family toxin [Pseudonocardia sp.]|uniref:type II toxin-antitoxin system VapC family toxin n=1 Tax=Pseudonocardia sp. TaxID=60912 RepID=UPI002ED96077